MITLLIGKKGSGKTKKLIELANEAVQNSNGNVVVIEKGLKLSLIHILMAMDAKRRPNGAGWTLYLNGGRVDTDIDAVE